MVRRWISVFVATLVLANLATGPSAVLAEVLEHANETAQLDSQVPPVDPAPAQCQHGCAGHFGQHFQWHVPSHPTALQTAISEPVAAASDAVPSLHIPALPFRPPLSSSIRS